MNIMKTLVLGLGLLIVPLIVNAQGSLFDFFGTILDLLNLLAVIVIALAVLYFFWGLSKYVLKASDENAKEEGRGIMIWGIIAIFVMVSVWGLIQLLQSTFDVKDGNPIIPREVQRSGTGGGSTFPQPAPPKPDFRNI